MNLISIDNAASRKGAVGSSEEFLISRTEFEWLQRLAAIVEFSDDAIITKTIEGVVTSWNSGVERVFGYSAQEMLGQSIFRLACVGGEEDMIAVLDQIRRGERVPWGTGLAFYCNHPRRCSCATPRQVQCPGN